MGHSQSERPLLLSTIKYPKTDGKGRKVAIGSSSIYDMLKIKNLPISAIFLFCKLLLFIFIKKIHNDIFKKKGFLSLQLQEIYDFFLK
jgi:hypothetical protein